MVDCTRGSSRKENASSRSGSKASSCLTASSTFWTPHWLASELPLYRRIWRRLILRKDALQGCSKNGARLGRVITFIIQAGGNHHQRLHCSSMHCDTAIRTRAVTSYRKWLYIVR